MTKRKTHPRIGSDFEDFLRDEGRLEEATAVAIKRVLAWEIQRAMDSAGVSQAEMARRMKTSRAVVRRLLDDSDPSVTLATISRAAFALGKQVRLKLAASSRGRDQGRFPSGSAGDLRSVERHDRGRFAIEGRELDLVTPAAGVYPDHRADVAARQAVRRQVAVEHYLVEFSDHQSKHNRPRR